MTSSQGFQSQVNAASAPGVAGDYASTNTNQFTYLAGPGGLVAGAAGLTIGNFAWVSYSTVDADGAPAVANNNSSDVSPNFGAAAIGFVHREQQGLNTAYLTEAGMTIPAGFPVTLHSSGDFWVANSGSGQAVPGMKAYASLTTGAATFNWTGTPTTASATASTIAAGTAATFTGSIAGNVLTTGAVTNTIYLGAILTGTGVASGTSIVSQLSGTAGGAGTYSLSVPEQTITSVALTATPYVLDTTGGTVTGTIVLGSLIQSAGGTATGTVVGGSVAVLNQPATGKYIVNTNGGTVTSGTIVLASNYETKWYARSSGLTGEVVKISSTA